MKTQNQLTLKLAGLISVTMFAALLISMVSCNTTTKKSETAENEIETVVKTPSVDVHTAAFMGNTKAMKQHIAAGSDLNAKDQYGSTPLQIATIFGKTETAIVLITGGADLDLTGNDGSTALHTAAFFCRTEIVEALINNGANKSLRNSYGSTALESVQAPFDSVKAIYEQLSKDLGSLGLKFDFDYLEATRPKVAELLKDNEDV